MPRITDVVKFPETHYVVAQDTKIYYIWSIKRVPLLWHSYWPMAKGRKPNAITTVELTIAATPKLIRHLKDLVKTELFGKTPADVALTLVRERIRQLQAERHASR